MKHFYTFLVAILFTSLGFGQTVFINEIHYDDASGDSGEGIEIAGPAGTDLSSYTLTPYNGNGGTTYSTTSLSGIIPNQGGTGYGTVFFAISGLQNGAPDGIALDNSGTLIQFLSYEGSFTASSGVASGQTSTDIGVSENGSVEGESLQLSGTGTTYTDFTWNASASSTYDAFNNGQTFSAGAPTTSVQFASASTTVLEDVGTIDLTFEITNEDATNATSFDVVLTTGDAADINGYTTQTVMFPAGSATNETLTITITDDTVFEGDETLTFSISGVTGGNNATVGLQATFDLTIVDNEAAPPVTEVAFQSFEGGDSWNYTTDPTTFNVSGAVWDVADNSFHSFGTIPSNGTNFFGIQDLNSTNGTSGFGSIDFETISVAGLSDVVVKFDYEVDGFDSDDDMKYELFEDNISQGEVVFIDGFSNLNADGTIEINVTPGTTNIRLVVSVRQNGGGDYGALDNFRVEGFYSGLTYANGSWTPSTPDGTTGTSDAIIVNGVATLSSDVSLNNLVVNPGAGLEVASGTTLTLNSLTLESVSTSYSSLILDGSIAGTVTYNRSVNSFTNDATNNDNDLISAPVTGQAFGSFDSANANLLASGTTRAFAPFNNITGGYENYDATTNAATTLDAATGYRVATTDGGTLSFTGNAEGGNISKNVTVGDDITYGVWNLIGNPYPSYIDAETFLTHVVSTESSGERNIDLMESPSGIYGYDGNASDDWKIITLANASGELIAPGQGFFIAADGNDVLAHDIEFTPAMRTTGSSDDFIAGRNSSSLTFLELNASTANNNYNTEFYFNSNASQGLDSGYDAVIWGGSAPSFAIYSHLVQDNTGLPIALQALSDTDYTNVTIPLGVNANQGEQLTFSISETTLPNTVNVYLEDNLSNTFTLLNTSDYILTPNTNLMGTGRFYIHFTNTTLSTTENVFDSLTIYADQTNRSIYIAGEVSENTVAKVYDIQGRLISSKTLTTNLRLQSIDVNNINPGVYIVELSNTSQNKTQKVILK